MSKCSGNIRTICGLAAATCCLTLSLPAAAEDLTVVYNVTVPKPYLVGPVSGTATLWISASKVRWSNGSKDWVFEVATGRKIFIDHQKQEYIESTPDEREADRRAAAAKAEELKAKAKEEEELKTKSKQAEAKPEGENSTSTLDEEMGKLRARSRRSQERLQELQRKVKYELEQRPNLTPTERQKLLALLAYLANLEERGKESLALVEKEFAQLPPVFRDNIGKHKRSVLTNISRESHKGTSKKDILGYSCEQYITNTTYTYADGSKKDLGPWEVWVTPELESPLSFDIVSEVANLSPPRGTGGFPLGATDWDNGGVQVDYQAIEIKRAPIDPSAFEVLGDGYTKRERVKP
jgi:hypothetical protein